MIRPARAGDIGVMHQMLLELADYERSRHMVAASEDDLRAALLAEPPYLFGHVAEEDGDVAGFAVWFVNYSTWTGRHGIYLEDLYVRPERRGRGHGTALLAELARICVERGWERLQWWVLDWNEPSIRFYRSLGAQAMDEWTVYRLAGRALRSLGGAGRPGGPPGEGGRG